MHLPKSSTAEGDYGHRKRVRMTAMHKANIQPSSRSRLVMIASLVLVGCSGKIAPGFRHVGRELEGDRLLPVLTLLDVVGQVKNARHWAPPFSSSSARW